MSTPFSSFCEDFYVNVRLGSQLKLPHQRETLLHFFERVQKEFPGLNRFRKHDNGDINLEEDRAGRNYRWLCLEAKRLCAGHVNPTSIDEALRLHTLLLQLAPFHLGVSRLEIDHLDVLFGFDFSFKGNHDEVIAESLFADSPLNCLGEEPGVKVVECQPSMTWTLRDDCRLQVRLDLVTRTNSYQIRTGEFPDDLISVYLVLRRYWGDHPQEPFEEIMKSMAETAERLCEQYVLPRVVRPINATIASKS